MSSKIRVLLVDDEPGVLHALKRLLSRRGFDVEVAHGGKEALDNLATTRPDVIVTDFKMPGLDGAQVLVAAAARLPSARRILLSGCADLTLSVDATFLPKPWDEGQLLFQCGLGRLP